MALGHRQAPNGTEMEMLTVSIYNEEWIYNRQAAFIHRLLSSTIGDIRGRDTKFRDVNALPLFSFPYGGVMSREKSNSEVFCFPLKYLASGFCSSHKELEQVEGLSVWYPVVWITNLPQLTELPKAHW